MLLTAGGGIKGYDISQVKFKDTMPTRRGITRRYLAGSGVKCLQKVWKLFERKFYLPPASRGDARGKSYETNATILSRGFPELSFN